MTWDDAWTKLNADGNLEERSQQRELAEAVFAITESGGTLLGEAGTGTGKSFAYLIPLIYAARRDQRSVVSTETLALMDQLVDKDLPFLKKLFGGFEYASLKGRNNYLCTRRDANHGLVLRVRDKYLGKGERRDVERVLGYRLDDQDWNDICSTSDFCASNKCKSDWCYSQRAREVAAKADIVITNHSVLQAHADYEILGDFKHLVVDEAHTLEKVLIDGWSEQVTPWDLYTHRKSINEGVGAAYDVMMELEPHREESEKLFTEGLDIVIDYFMAATAQKYGRQPTDLEWKRETFTLSQQALHGPQSDLVVRRLHDLEEIAPGKFARAFHAFDKIHKVLNKELDKEGISGKRKIRKGATAAKRLADICDKVGEALTTSDATVFRFGAPYAVLGDGWKPYKSDAQMRIRCVPLDVSARAAETIWKGLKSVTLVSATLADTSPGDYRYTVASLGLTVDKTVTVNSPFDYAQQQLVYFSDLTRPPVEVPGAQFSMDELVELVRAADGRSLVLFTARSELEFAAEEIQRYDFPHTVLVQDVGADKRELVERFKDDKHSVLLATKSFFTGVDFPGDTLSLVVLAKYPLPQYNALCRAQIKWWKKRGYSDWYEREGMLVFRQAIGRLIRSETDHGVVALLDQRLGMREKAANICYASPFTNTVGDVEKWLSTPSRSQLLQAQSST